MIKVCILTTVHQAYDTRIFYKEIKTLSLMGYNVTFIVPHDTDEVIGNIKIRALTKPRNRFQRMCVLAWYAINLAKQEDANLYHFHDSELLLVGLLLKAKNKNVIYDVHEDLPRQILSKHWIPAPLRKPISWIVERIEDYAAKQFDYVVTATPYIRDRFLKINKNTIDVNNYPLLSELHIPNTDWGSKEKLVCYVGGISKIRGIQEMVQAIGITRYSMLLAGKFESSVEREIAVNREGWSRVIELGHVNRAEVKEILSRSMAGLVLFHPNPNHINAQPNKMFEYMSAGIPVIASHFPLWKQIVEGNNCGICVDPLNINEIANAIIWIIENPEQAELMGENGRRAVEKYNWEQESNKLIHVYKELLV